jgi:Arc/MetJ-type ribon-helix-helix transcriptional regulator
MKVALPPEQMKWLEAEVSAGRFNSVDDAIAAAVAALCRPATTIWLGQNPM